MGTACKFNVITGFVTYEPGLLIALRNCTEDGVPQIGSYFVESLARLEGWDA